MPLRTFLTRWYNHPVVGTVIFLVVSRGLVTLISPVYAAWLPQNVWQQLTRWHAEPFYFVSLLSGVVAFLLLPQTSKEAVLTTLRPTLVGVNDGSARWKFWGMVATCFVFGVIVQFLDLTAERLTAPYAPNLQSLAVLPGILPGMILTQFLVVFAEEFAWRAVVTSLLMKQFLPKPTLILAGLSFGFWHLFDGHHNLLDGLVIGCTYGLWCGALLYRTGSVWPAVSLHLSMNLALFSYDVLIASTNSKHTISLYYFLAKLVVGVVVYSFLLRFRTENQARIINGTDTSPVKSGEGRTL